MEERPWWPKGIVQSHDESSISTSWGTRPLHIPEITLDWWNSLSKTWGDWPVVEKFEQIDEDRSGIWFDIGEYKALVIPIPTGKHASRLSRNPQLKSALDKHLQLPIAGYDKDGDHVLIYPKDKPAKITAKSLAGLHVALIDGGWSTPNDEHGWNSRLKKVEDTIKTSTLWRAPHSFNTIGIPRIELDRMRPIPLPLGEVLMWNNETNLPMIRQAMKHDVILKWREFIPSKYWGEDVMRIATGGIAHLKYDLNILSKAESVAFGIEVPEIDQYLTGVDRVQAKLGNMRLMQMGIPLAIFGLIISYWLSRAGEFANPEIGYWTFGIIGFASLMLYSITEPDWRHEL
tara:strand:- start:3256 stop:4290 length:1035 start_codon:yes stop_codon:yes gene_type:complete